jgi:hypothetical protein
MEILLSSIGLLLLVSCLWLYGQAQKKSGQSLQTVYLLATGLASTLAVLSLLTGSVLFWYTHRPIPPNAHETLFEGITYTRDVRRIPRPLVIHIVQVNLNMPGISFLVTPGKQTQGRELPARTTSQFLSEFDLQVAVNGDFFEPWHSDSPWDYYPHVGDPVDVLGFASSKSAVYSQEQSDHPTLYISSDNQARFNAPIGSVYSALSGSTLFVKESQVQTQGPSSYLDMPQPRTAIALDKAARSLIILVVDGRQPNYSEGVTLAELAQIVLEYGGDTALNLDGGGSTTLIVEGKSGRPIQLNSPIDNRIPGRERPVANHLGIYAHRP